MTKHLDKKNQITQNKKNDKKTTQSLIYTTLDIQKQLQSLTPLQNKERKYLQYVLQERHVLAKNAASDAISVRAAKALSKKP